MSEDLLTTLLLAGGVGHFGVLVASALVPFRLDWRKELACLSRLHRQMYWVYGGYVVLSIVAFGLMQGANRPGEPSWVKEQVAMLFPNARVLSHDWHDWVDDPFARGTWVAAPAGHEAGLDAANWQPEGRIAFASSDHAREQAGWFEGAVIAGEDAAGALLGIS